GCPRLVVADGSETFDTVKSGEPVTERTDPGEIVWRDEAGVTCRRGDWRQCRPTAVRAEAESPWFVIGRLAPLPARDLRPPAARRRGADGGPSRNEPSEHGLDHAAGAAHVSLKDAGRSRPSRAGVRDPRRPRAHAVVSRAALPREHGPAARARMARRPQRRGD